MEAPKIKVDKYRGFNKSNLLNWLILLEKNGYVMCSFKNCNYMAFDIDGMADHYSRCNSDKSNIKYICQYCSGGTDTEDNLLKHKVLHHPQHANIKDFSDFGDKELSLFPSSSSARDVSYVMKRSWQVFLETKRYIKCLVQTCLYVTNSIEQMTTHYNNYCSPYYREQLTYVCFTCQGRTDNLSDLKKHCKVAHPTNKTETNSISPPIIHYWSELLREFNWAKCFNSKCNFIECDINTLKAHYSTCINPSKHGLVECSKCRGWLNGFTRLRKHIKAAHNPINPKPIIYMVPVKLVKEKVVPFSDAKLKMALSTDSNSSVCEALCRIFQGSTYTNISDIVSSEKNESSPSSVQPVKKCQQKTNETSEETPKIFDCSSFSEDELDSSSSSSSTDINEKDDSNDDFESTTPTPNNDGQLSNAHLVSKSASSTGEKSIDASKILSASILKDLVLGGFRVESLSESYLDDSVDIDYFSSSSKDDTVSTGSQQCGEGKQSKTAGVYVDDSIQSLKSSQDIKTYSHISPVTKKLPRIYPAFIPKTTFEIDCNKAQRGQVTFPKDIMDANEWKLELPHVALRNRNKDNKKKRIPPVPMVNAALNKIAQGMTAGKGGPLVPVSFEINELNNSLTVRVPSINLKQSFQPKLTTKKNLVKVDEGKTNFKEAYWDNIEADMVELLNLSVQNSLIRNTIRYHRHKTRSKLDERRANDSLFEYDSTNEEELADDPRKDLGLSSENDSDCDDLFIDEPIDFSILPEDYDALEPQPFSLTKPDHPRGSWCVKLVERPQHSKDKEKLLNKDFSSTEQKSQNSTTNTSSDASGSSCSTSEERDKSNTQNQKPENSTLDNNDTFSLSLVNSSLDSPVPQVNDITYLGTNKGENNVGTKDKENNTVKEVILTNDKCSANNNSLCSKTNKNMNSKNQLEDCLSTNINDKLHDEVNKTCEKSSVPFANHSNDKSPRVNCNDSNYELLNLSIENKNKEQDNVGNKDAVQTTPPSKVKKHFSEEILSDQNHGSMVNSSLVISYSHCDSKNNQDAEVSNNPINDNNIDDYTCLDLTVKSCRQEVVSTTKQPFVCSDGIHCGTDDESVGSPDATDCQELSQDESNRPDSGSVSNSNLNPNTQSTDISESNVSESQDKCSFPSIVIKKESGFQEESAGCEESLNDLPQNINLRGVKRKIGSPVSPGNIKTPRVEQEGASCENLIIPDLVGSGDFDTSLNESCKNVENSNKRKCGRPKKKPVDNTAGTSGTECPVSISTPVRRTSRKKTQKFKTNDLDKTPDSSEGRPSFSSENVIIPDQDFSTVEESLPVPSRIINMDALTPDIDESSLQKQRKPKNKRSTDIMAGLGDRITPSSSMSFPKKRVTCAICSETMSAKDYQIKHLMKHNFICWLVDEMPLPLEDFNTMVLVANRGKRAHPEHVFKCEKCKRPCKSSSGYLCHIRFCGKSKEEIDSLMVACTQCNRLFKPNCIDQHMRMAHSKALSIPEQISATSATASPRSTVTNSRKKISELIGILSAPDDVEVVNKPISTPEKVEPTNRIITKKMLKSWKEADAKGSPLFCPITNCDFRCNCYDTIQSHYRVCNPLDPSQQVFVCKQCPYQTNFKENYLVHMKEEHCLLVHLPDNVAFYPIKYLKELEDYMFCSFTWVRCTTVFKPCLQLTKELRDNYLSKESLFPDLLVSWDCWSSLEDDNPIYQPDYHTSPAIRYNSTNEWLRLPCYSAATFKGESLLWTGGCVHSMAWCPSPPNLITDQYLAVSCLLNFNQVFTIGNTYKQPTTVQLWNYGPLLNSDSLDNNSDLVKTPMLAYALCINEGPVWDLEWCSSGCYDLRRLGLLACATASGAVNIYALPHPNQLNIPPERCPLFKGVPTLRLMYSRNQSFQCQKISWSKVKPHKLIAGGFVNGFVALWDLSVTSTFLREGSILYPCRLFQAHHSTVTSLKMCPVDSNYILTGSLDKSVKLWDLRDVSNPVHSMVRGGVTDLDWLTNWLSFSFGMDAGVTPSPSSAFLSSVRDFSFNPVPLIGHPTATVKSISTSDWLNCIATGYDDGNVILTSCLRQFGDGSDAKKKIAKFILRSELIDLANDNEKSKKSKEKPEDVSVPEDSTSYEDTINMFGISISTSKSIEDKSKVDSVEEPRNDVYPIHSVTKACFSPNQHSFLTLAVGFESGFVSAMQLSPSRQVFPEIQALSCQDVSALAEDYKL